VILAALASLLALSAAPAQASFVHFTSPSGNIDCIGDARAPAFAECLVQRASWPRLPPKPSTCDLDWVPTELDLGHRHVSVGACRGDVGPLCTTGSGRCTTLAYGHAVDIGPIRCSSATNGVTCRYRTTPRVGFRVAREGYTVFRS
jgi:hypothetical protein